MFLSGEFLPPSVSLGQAQAQGIPGDTLDYPSCPVLQLELCPSWEMNLFP